MQTTPAPPAATGTTDTGADPFSAVEAITTTHLILIAVLAVVVVIAMIYGARLKRRRTIAQHEEEQRLDAYDEEHPDAPAGPVTTGAGQEEQRPPVAAPPTPPHDPADEQVRPASAAGSGNTPPPPLAQSQSQVRGPVPVAPAIAPADGAVTQLKGLGPKVAARLAELGITTVGQIAALDDDAAEALDSTLGAFQGRIARDRWVEQARFLAAGDRAGFEAVFGRL